MSRSRTLADGRNNLGEWLARLSHEVKKWPFTWQVGGATAVFVISAWLTITTVSYIGSRSLVSDTVDAVRNLEASYADLLAESQLSTAAFVDQVEQLEGTANRQRDAIEELYALRDALQRQLASRERQLDTMTAQRDRARREISELGRTVSKIGRRLEQTVVQRDELNERLMEAESQVAEISNERDTGRRVEVGLRWQLSRLENELGRLRARRETAQVWLKDWVLSSAEALEQLFDHTGVDVERLVARVAEPDLGQGGPLQTADLGPIASAPIPRPDDSMSGKIHRLAALQRLARRLPLVSPLDHFNITSTFGKRRDPFTKGLAYHAGLDLGAAWGTEILATAPGRVVQASPNGAYGKMVEVDHGMGIITRYGHLQSINVEIGDEVAFRQPIGVIGSTGRSTGVHLHYEIRIDDKPYDPTKFLDAGRLLVGVFDVASDGRIGPGG
jgi:murein DD-endopeptidase MepM/ murein hydrolase activator NlpD